MIIKMAEINGGLGVNLIAKKYDWNKSFKVRFGCNWKKIPYDNYKGWMEYFFKRLTEENVIRMFTDLQPWGIPTSLYKNLASDNKPTAEVHQPAMNKLFATLDLCEKYDKKLMITFLNNCSQRERDWSKDYYSNEWLEKYHKPWIKNITDAIKPYQSRIIAEWCNEGHGGWEWEEKGAQFLRNLGYEITCTSSERDFEGVYNNTIFDFHWYHGLWLHDIFVTYFLTQHPRNDVFPSTDGWSDLQKKEFWGGKTWASKFPQFEGGIGNIPNTQWIKMFLKKLGGKSFSINFSGYIEKPEPNIGLINDANKAVKEIYGN